MLVGRGEGQDNVKVLFLVVYFFFVINWLKGKSVKLPIGTTTLIDDRCYEGEDVLSHSAINSTNESLRI